jgi:hypothetical protein
MTEIYTLSPEYAAIVRRAHAARSSRVHSEGRILSEEHTGEGTEIHAFVPALLAALIETTVLPELALAGAHADLVLSLALVAAIVIGTADGLHIVIYHIEQLSGLRSCGFIYPALGKAGGVVCLAPVEHLLQ